MNGIYILNEKDFMFLVFLVHYTKILEQEEVASVLLMSRFKVHLISIIFLDVLCLGMLLGKYQRFDQWA